jgi:predicted membrane-bound spermidine synthase
MGTRPFPKPGPLVSMTMLGLGEGLAQIILLREVMNLAGGNEFSLGLSLALWLFWTALGSYAASRLLAHRPLKSPLPALILSGACGLASLALARLTPPLLGLSMGQAAGLGPSVLYCLMALAPAGFMGGAHFPMLLGVMPGAEKAALGRLYGWEAIGGALAGAGFGLLLVPHLEPLTLLTLSALLAVLLGLWVRSPHRSALGGLWVIGLAGLLIFTSPLEAWLKARLWQGHRLTAWTESPYGQLAATATGEQRNYYSSGNWLFSRPDRLTLERQALVPVLAAPKAKSALFIGGGVKGSAALALKRGGLEQVVAVELDPWLAGLADGQPAPPGLTLIYGDGRRLARSSPQRFDLIAVDLPPPDTLRLNRFYSAEGMADLAGVLRPGGVLVLRLPGVQHLMGPLQAARIKSVLGAVPDQFKGRALFSGQELFICLYQDPQPVENLLENWLMRFTALGWDGLAGVRADTILAALDPMRQEQLLDQLQQAGPGPPNRDYLPRALLFDPGLWGVQLGGASRFSLWLGGLTRSGLRWALGLILLPLLLWGIHRLRRGGLGAWVVNLGMLVMGLSGMGLSLLLLLIHQVVSGAVYLGLALLLAAFMLGQALAALWAEKAKGALRSLAGLHGIFMAAAFITGWLAHLLPGWGWAWPMYGLSLICGGLVGVYFAWAGRNQTGVAAAKSLVRLGGGLYAYDLMGGLCGALLPVVLLPCVGLWGVLETLLWLNLAAAGLSIAASKPTCSGQGG